MTGIERGELFGHNAENTIRFGEMRNRIIQEYWSINASLYMCIIMHVRQTISPDPVPIGPVSRQLHLIFKALLRSNNIYCILHGTRGHVKSVFFPVLLYTITMQCRVQ